MPAAPRTPPAAALSIITGTSRRTRTIAVGVLVAAAAATFVMLDRTSTGPVPAPRVASASAAPDSTAHDGVSPAAAPDVTWREVAGVRVPFSRLHGPRSTTAGRAAGYSRTETGAALAAVQVLLRTSPSGGPAVFEPVLATQVTGAHLPALKVAASDEYERLRAQQGVPEGQPVPADGAAQIAGYVVRAFDADAGTASLDVVLTSPDLSPGGRFVAFRVALVWQQDDWRVVAPPDGDWGAVATTLGAAPAGVVEYGG